MESLTSRICARPCFLASSGLLKVLQRRSLGNAVCREPRRPVAGPVATLLRVCSPALAKLNRLGRQWAEQGVQRTTGLARRRSLRPLRPLVKMRLRQRESPHIHGAPRRNRRNESLAVLAMDLGGPHPHGCRRPTAAHGL